MSQGGLTKEDITDQRLERIEQKLDTMASTLISLARAEEKLAGLEKEKRELGTRTKDLETKMIEHDEKIHDNAVTIKIINRVFWIVLSTAITVLVGKSLVDGGIITLGI